MIYALVILSGVAALSWEVLWQLKASLAFGISALGTAITLATTMAGMALGSRLGAYVLGRWPGLAGFRFYALLELGIALSGLLLPLGFAGLEQLDITVYRSSAALASWVQAGGIGLLLGVPALAMGATLPCYARIARERGLSLSVLYTLNTLGAAVGCLLLALVVIPSWGVGWAIRGIALINLLVAAVALLMRSSGWLPEEEGAAPADGVTASETWLAFLTGFATFSLEVSWFRALRAAFQSTTASFAVMLASVLLALTVGGALARRRWAAGPSLVVAGTGVLLVTPILERFDLLMPKGGNYWFLLLNWLVVTLLTLGVPIAALGRVLPAMLDRHRDSAPAARLYAFNTVGAVLGSLLSGWLLLPQIGFVRTAWLVGLVVGLRGCWELREVRRTRALVALGLALTLAVLSNSGVGVTRVPSRPAFPKKVLSFSEGPDSQVAVVEKLSNQARCLLIDGFVASSQQENGHYMVWMGRVPMLLHPHPQKALVICFGTGQTINAVRQEGPEWADVVDLNARVLENAPLFASNQGVLQDPRVHPHVMDGRAWMRRTPQRYDVITLEPMPPRLAGVNALYSREFYQLAHDHLQEGGLVAQWLPFHLQNPRYSIAIAATFQSVFPDCILWQDPRGDGILVGRRSLSGQAPLGQDWPGLLRSASGRDMSPEDIRRCAWISPKAMAHYVSLDGGRVITDDNQMLAYGGELRFNSEDFGANMVWVEWAYNLTVVEEAVKNCPELQPLYQELAAGNPRPPSWPALKASLANRPDRAGLVASLRLP